MERLQKVIAASGYASRRQAESLILAGRVKVNNLLVSKLGTKVNPQDIVMIDDQRLRLPQAKVYYLLNKPRNVICSTRDEFQRLTVLDLIKSNSRIYPVGRLDYDTSGLLLLTNDGNLAHKLMHPKFEIAKTYLVKITGILTLPELEYLKNNLIIDGRRVRIQNFRFQAIKPQVNQSVVQLTLFEGRKHLVKNIFQLLHHPVLELSRIQYAFLTLGHLKPGQYRHLTLSEIKKLNQLKKSPS